MEVSNHTQLINYLIEKHNLESYCEIGLQNAANNFNKIKCHIKCSVDPDPKARAMFDCTSDEFFKFNTTNFSLFFIDGYHEASQVVRDFNNAMKFLNEGGFIIWHDTVPEYEAGTFIPRNGVKRWWGNVYLEAMRLSEYDNIDFVTYPIDEGCTVVWKDNSKKGVKIKHKITWDFYVKNRQEYMRFIDNSNNI